MKPARWRGAAPVALIVLLAACQPLPHPFADDRPPPALLRVRDSIGVSIAPIVGAPEPASGRLADAMAQALLKHDIPASDKTTSLDSYQLYGRLDELRPRGGKAKLVALWRLYDAKGHTVGERRAEVPLADGRAQAADDKLIEKLAGLSADRVAPLLEDQPATAKLATAKLATAKLATAKPAAANSAAKPSAAPEAHITRVAIGTITGAPGDGGAALAHAVAAVLRARGLAIAGKDDKPDLYVDCAVSIVPAAGGAEHVAIVWRVRRAGGGEIGTVGQQNDVPKAALAGKWGDLAFNIATAAGSGLMQLVARGLPEPQP